MGKLRRVEKRKYQIQGIWEKHHEIKRMELCGLTSNKEIAKELGVTPQNICDIRGSEIYKAELQSAHFARDIAALDVARAIEEEGPKCLALLSAIRENNISVLGESAPLPLRAHVAQDLLDRNQKSAKVKQITGEFKHAHLVIDATVDRLKERAREITNSIHDAMEESAENGEEIISDNGRLKYQYEPEHAMDFGGGK